MSYTFSVKNLTVSIADGDLLLEQEYFDGNEFTCARISLTVEQVPLVIEQLRAAAEFKHLQEANNAHT